MDDHIAMARDCRGENVTVVGIGKVECGDQRFVSGDQAIPSRPVHETARAFQDRVVTVGLVEEQGIDPLSMDVRSPFGAKNIVSRQL